MTEGELLLRGILEEPECDTRRLVYADWLEENEQQERAEFIRLQIELRKYPKEANWLEQMPVMQWTGSEEEGKLLRRLDPLVKRHTELCHKHVKECGTWSREFIQTLLGRNCFQLTADWYWGWTRGFVSHITFSLSDYINLSASLFRLQPIERVVIVGAVRGNVVFRTSNGHHNDIPNDLWDALNLPKCGKVGGFCDMRGTHTHMNEDDLSPYLVAYGRQQAGLPPLYTNGQTAHLSNTEPRQ